MRVSINTTAWYERLCASFAFFTRLPVGRFVPLPAQAWETVVEHWPLVGCFTGAAAGLTLWFCALVLPRPIAVLLAIGVRQLITGAMHENGLGAFVEGLAGGWGDRARAVGIMSGRTIGLKGVSAIVVYELLLIVGLLVMPVDVATIAVFAGDAYSKLLASQTVQMLPLLVSSDDYRLKTGLRKYDTRAGISLFLQGFLPLLLLLWLTGLRWDLIVFVPCLTMYFTYLLLLRRLQGYTIEALSTMSLLCELALLLTVAMC